ncbi:uncharacterized protein LOC120826889 isoform X2 [Gasterosteus aculeatus]
MRLVGAEISVLSLLMMSLHGAAALTHSLKFFFTASSGVPNFPEFVSVGLLDEVEISHYDSDTRRSEPRQDWMIRVTEDDPQFWQRNTELTMGAQQDFRGHIEIAKRRFNQTGDYSQKEVEPDPADPFPEIYLSPGLGELTGPLLATTRPEALTLHEADKKTLYFNCVKGINRSGLCDRLPTVWSNRLGQNGPGPQWRILYKPPLKKRTADLQWRILHGAVASNAFISVINPTVLSKCPFCDLRETIYHVFTECKRLASFFSLLTSVFSLFNVVFTENIFIMGAAYKKAEKEKWQLLSYLSGSQNGHLFKQEGQSEGQRGAGGQSSVAGEHQGQALARVPLL